jgi:hypothetical protein
MMNARLAKEIVVRVPNRIGKLAQISKLVADMGYDLGAVCAFVEGNDAVIRLITEDNLRVVDALNAHGYRTHEREVVSVEIPHKPGMLRRITEDLARADVDLVHMYATAIGDRSLVVFTSTNNERALVAMRT